MSEKCARAYISALLPDDGADLGIAELVHDSFVAEHVLIHVADVRERGH